MVTSCCHGSKKSNDCGLKLLFYIYKGKQWLVQKISFFRFK